MAMEEQLGLIQRVMGAAQVFCSTVEDLLERTLEEASEEPLAMSQVKLLMLIGQPGRRYKVSDVAAFLGVTNAAASRAIDRLVQRGLIDRTLAVDDRRAVDLALTPSSRALLERFAAARGAELLRLLGDYPEARLRRAAELFDDLSVRLLDPEAHGERCLRCGIHFRESCVLRDVLGRECAITGEETEEEG